MTEGEYVNDYLARTLTIVNKLQLNKAKIEDVDVIEKILQSMTPKFNYVLLESLQEEEDEVKVECVDKEEVEASVALTNSLLNVITAISLDIFNKNVPPRVMMQKQ
ncbi:hypothetical protein CR513_53122, partial [Mucuna pruriens]